MAHYALLDANNVVVQVITGRNEWEDGVDWEEYYADFTDMKCKRTSYNGNIRGKYAAIGDVYDPIYDVFKTPLIKETIANNATTGTE